MPSISTRELVFGATSPGRKFLRGHFNFLRAASIIAPLPFDLTLRRAPGVGRLLSEESFVKSIFLVIVVACLLLPVNNGVAAEGSSNEVSVTVDLGNVVNTMRGGIGASWHAIEAPIPYSETRHPPFPNKSHGGSGWGAYPPAEDNAAWKQISRHARWLGFDWNRVEFEQRIYEPEPANSVGTTRRCASFTVFSIGANKTGRTCFCSRCGVMCVGMLSPSGATIRLGESTAARFRWRISARGWQRWLNTL